MPEITTKHLLFQCQHLLSELSSEDVKLNEEIEHLRIEIHNALYLCSIDYEEDAAKHLKEVISPRIDKLVTELGSRDTMPP